MKDTIFYHRAHRRVSIADKSIYLEFLFLTLPLLIAVLFLHSEITFFMSHIVRYLLLLSFPSIEVWVSEKPYIFGTIYILGLSGRYPSPSLSFILFLFSLLSIFFIPKTKISGPIAAWAIFISAINLISSVFFMLALSTFPYDIEKFSELYVKTEVAIWLFIPIVMGVILLPLPSNILSRFSVTVLTLLYSMAFGILRFAVFLYTIKKFSYIFMPLLYFAFGPLMDFTYIVGIYSLYLSIIAKKNNNRSKIGRWKWS